MAYNFKIMTNNELVFEKYGNEYEVASSNNAKLMRFAKKFCQENDIVFDVEKCFEYMHRFEEKEVFEQMTLFQDRKVIT